MLLNLTNHPYENWSETQRAAASAYGPVEDLPFPNISPYADSAEIDAQVSAYLARIAGYPAPVVLVQGEFVFTFRMVTRLKECGICALCACSERCVTERVKPDGSTEKCSEYRFAGFRAY